MSERGLRVASALVALACLATACKTGASSKAGAGADVNICNGIDIYNKLPEPVLTDPGQVLSYVDAAGRALARIKPGIEYKDANGTSQKASPQILAQVQTLRSSYQALRTQIAAATTSDQLKAAVNGFATLQSFNSADAAVELWVNGDCR